MNTDNAITLGVTIVATFGLFIALKACEVSKKNDDSFRECVATCVRASNPPIECRTSCKVKGN